MTTIYIEDKRNSFEEPLLEAQKEPAVEEPEVQQNGVRSIFTIKTALWSCASVFVLAVIGLIGLLTDAFGECEKHGKHDLGVSFDFGDMSEATNHGEYVGKSPLSYSGDEEVSAIACIDLQPPKNNPNFLEWPGQRTPFSDMASQVYETVVQAWNDDDYSTHHLYLEDILAIRVTESNSKDIDVPDYPHLDEAILQTLQSLGDNIPDASCVFGHDSTGALAAFVWGYDVNLVEATECHTGAVEKYCVAVDNDYFKTHPEPGHEQHDDFDDQKDAEEETTKDVTIAIE